MNRIPKNPARELLLELQRRVPAGQHFIQEAFSSEHRRPVMVKLGSLQPDTFYFFDEMTAVALGDTVIDWAARHGGARLTLTAPAFGEARARQHRLQHIAGKLGQIRLLAVGQPGPALAASTRIEVHSIAANPLARYRLALVEGSSPMLFVSREGTWKGADGLLSLGFFTFDGATIDEMAEDIDLVLRGLARRLDSFERLELLHQATQRISRELESYSRRMDLAVRRARRRPDLLTPARFNRIVGQAIAKMEQLKEIPRRALRVLDRPPR